MKDIEMNDIVTLKNGTHVKILDKVRNPERYSVIEVEFGYTGIKLKSIRYSININDISMNHGFINEGVLL